MPIVARAQEPFILGRARVDPSKPIDFHAAVSPESLYVGQQTTYQVAVYLDEIAGSRLRRNPEFLPPEMRGLLSYDLGTPTRYGPREMSGKRYTMHVFQKALFPLASGTLVVPSPKLSYSLPQSASYFSREEAHIVSAESTTVYVKALPDEGRPADFTGAVGVFKSSVHLDAATARVGDPLVLTLRVQGTGNVKLLPRPTLEVEWASSVASTERLQVDTTGAVVKGAKEFDWILTPSREGDVVTPSVRYSYFNPYTRKYEVAEADPVALRVQTGSLATPEEGEKSTTSALPLRDHSVGTVSPPATERWQWWALFALMPLPAIALLFASAPRIKPKAAPIEGLRSLVQKAGVASTVAKNATGGAPTSARDVRRLLISSLAKRLDISPEVMHERARTERLMLRRGVTRETTKQLLAKLGELDIASFASGNIGSNSRIEFDTAAAPSTGNREYVSALSKEAVELYEKVDREALPLTASLSSKRKGRSKPIIVSGLLFLVGAISATPVRAQIAGDPWSAAVAAYKNHSYVDASEDFLRIAVASPRDADALANWGIASWAAGDTVSAVMAWQRAVRLDPLAADLRENLLLLPSGARDGVAEIPMVPVNAFTYVAIVAWGIGWLTLAVVLWRKRAKHAPRPLLNALAVIAIVVGGACAGASAWGTRQLRSVALAVVVRPETMRAGPDNEADALGGAATGDVVRVEARQSLWSHVQHSDGREGWLPNEHLAPLTDSSLQ